MPNGHIMAVFTAQRQRQWVAQCESTQFAVAATNNSAVCWDEMSDVAAVTYVRVHVKRLSWKWLWGQLHDSTTLLLLLLHVVSRLHAVPDVPHRPSPSQKHVITTQSYIPYSDPAPLAQWTRLVLVPAHTTQPMTRHVAGVLACTTLQQGCCASVCRHRSHYMKRWHRPQNREW